MTPRSFFHMDTTTGTPTDTHIPQAIDVKYARKDGWTLTVAHGTITDAQAKAITFRAEPRQVVMGDFVQVVDDGGTRIGLVKTAEYVESFAHPSFVRVTIELR